MLYELIGSDGLIGLFSDRAVGLLIAREWLHIQRAHGRSTRTVVLHILDDDRRLCASRSSACAGDRACSPA